MSNDKIIAAWNRMNPDSNTKIKILQQIQDTMETGKTNNFTGNFRRLAVIAVAAIVLLSGTLGTVYAASPAFREYVHTLLFPLYTSDKIVSIKNGHMTSSFDKTDVLLSFLDKFNKENLGDPITAKKENGYHYSLSAQNENRLLAFVDSNIKEYCIVVYMERIPYENTTGIWQVTGYQILEKSTAENMKNSLEPYFDEQPEETISIPPKNTAITGAEYSVIMYNVNNKNAISISEDDSKAVSDILSACDRYENITGGLFQYVIKINNVSYMFDSNGNGMEDKAGNLSGIIINENGMNTIIELFKKYNIPLTETK